MLKKTSVQQRDCLLKLCRIINPGLADMQTQGSIWQRTRLTDDETQIERNFRLLLGPSASSALMPAHLQSRELPQLRGRPKARLQSLLLPQASWTELTSELSKQLWPAAHTSRCRKRQGWRLCLRLQLRRSRRLPSRSLQPRNPHQPRRLQFCGRTASFSTGMAAANAGPCLEDVVAARSSLRSERMGTLSYPRATLLRRSSDRHR